MKVKIFEKNEIEAVRSNPSEFKKWHLLHGSRMMPVSLLFSSSVCPVAPGTGAAASAPVSAAGRASAVCWVPRRRLAVWRRTICSPPARQEGGPVGPREGAALPPDSAVMQVRKYWKQ